MYNEATGTHNLQAEISEAQVGSICGTEGVDEVQVCVCVSVGTSEQGPESVKN